MRDGVLLCARSAYVADPPKAMIYLPYLAVPNHIQKRNNVWSTAQVLQDLDLTLDLLLLHRFQDLDDTFLVVDDIDAFEDLRVLSSTCSNSLISP